MQENNFNATIQSLFHGMDNFITTKTVVGDAIHIGDTIILPLVDVSFAVGAGIFVEDKKNNGGGALGGKINPTAVLVIQNGTTKLVNVKNQDGITKILDMIPDFVDKFTSKHAENKKAKSKAAPAEEKAKAEAGEKMKDMLNISLESKEV